MNEGIVKYNCEWTKTSEPFITKEELIAFNEWRSLLVSKKLIGVLPEGIGYGNISIRFGKTEKFIITGTQTGHLPELSIEHFALVTEYYPEKNYLKCRGLTKASSEALSHSVFYAVKQRINAVIHVHSQFIWQKYLHKLPTSDIKAEYGTVDLAKSITAIFESDGFDETGTVIMGGHTDGVIVCGFSLDEAGKKIITLCS